MVRGLGRAVDGRTYQAWVKRPGSATQFPAGLFDGADGVVRLTQPVTPGSTVSVTVEDADGAIQPSHIPRLTASFLALGSDSRTVLAQLLRPVQRGIRPLEEARGGLAVL